MLPAVCWWKKMPLLCQLFVPPLIDAPSGVLDRRVVWTCWCWWLCFRGAERGPKDRGCPIRSRRICGGFRDVFWLLQIGWQLKTKSAPQRGSSSSTFVSGRKGFEFTYLYMSSYHWHFMTVCSWLFISIHFDGYESSECFIAKRNEAMISRAMATVFATATWRWRRCSEKYGHFEFSENPV